MERMERADHFIGDGGQSAIVGVGDGKRGMVGVVEIVAFAVVAECTGAFDVVETTVEELERSFRVVCSLCQTWCIVSRIL